MERLERIGVGCHCITYGYKHFAIKVGHIPEADVAFLRSLPDFRPKIYMYVRHRYIPLLGRTADILIMKRYKPLIDQNTMCTIRKIMADRLAWYMKRDLARYHNTYWVDDCGDNVATDGKEFFIIDA